MNRASLLRATVVMALLLGLLLGGPPDRTLFWDSLFDVGHAALFAVATFFILGIVASVAPAATWSQTAAITLTISLALGAVTEIIQIVEPTRDASVGDFLRDAAGASICLALWLAAGLSATELRRARLLRTGAAVIAVATIIPFASVASNYVSRNQAFPVVLPLDGSRWVRQFVRVTGARLTLQTSVPGALHTGGDRQALLALRPGTFPGFLINEPYPDWRGYERLAFSIASAESEPLTIRLRVSDRWHDGRLADRFNRLIEIHQGVQQVRVDLREMQQTPGGRVMDLANISDIALYAYQLDRPARFYVSEFHLE